MERGGGTGQSTDAPTSGSKVNWVSGSGGWVVPFPGRAGLGEMLPWGGVQSLRCLRDPGGDMAPSAWSLAGQETSPQRGWGLVPTAKRRENALREEWWQCQVPMGDSETRTEDIAFAGVRFDSPILSGDRVRGPQSKAPQFW